MEYREAPRGPASGAREIPEVEQLRRRQADLVAMLAHDLRTPLSVISGGLDEIEEMHGLDAGHREMLELVRRGARRLESLSEQLLEVSELDRRELAPHLEDVDLVHLVESLVEQTDHLPDARDKDIEVHAPETLIVAADPGLISRVVQNLLSNAVRHAAQRVEVSLSTRQDWVDLVVADDGEGIDPRVLPRVFDRFVRGGEPGGERGLGLGLAIVAHLVEVHGGSVDARNHEPISEGPGARFTATLPRRVSRTVLAP